MQRLTRPLALAASLAALLGVAACSAEPAPAPAASPSPTAEPTPAASLDPGEASMAPIEDGTPTEGHYEYLGADYAHLGAFDLPGTCPADLATALATLGASDAACITVDVDNREGTDGVNLYAVNLFDADGEQYVYQDAYSALVDLRDASGAEVDVDLMNKYQEFVDMGARRDVHLVYTGTSPLPSAVSRVTVQPNGAFDVVEAYKGAQ